MTRASNIRRLFLESKSSYPLQDAASILGMSVRELRERTEAGEIEGAETDHGLVVPWAELVTFAMGFWDQEEVEEALGSELASVIPELVRLTDLEVRIPKMEVVVLERVARGSGRASMRCSRGSCWTLSRRIRSGSGRI